MFSKLLSIRSWLKVILIFIILMQMNLLTSTYDYCYGKRESILCQGRRHIACDKSVNRTNAFVTLMPLTNSFKNRILTYLNRQRNRYAREEGYSCMRRILWDEELAMLSSLQARKCTETGPQCVKTQRFKFAQARHVFIKINYRLDLHAVIDRLYGAAGLKPQFMTESVAQVGCAIGYCQETIPGTAGPPYENHLYFFTCIFPDGPSASPAPPGGRKKSREQCMACWGTKSDPEFVDLCANDGKIRERGFVYSKKLMALK